MLVIVERRQIIIRKINHLELLHCTPYLLSWCWMWKRTATEFIFALSTVDRRKDPTRTHDGIVVRSPERAVILEGQDSHYEIANWTEDDEEKVPEKAKRVKNKKKRKKKKKAEAPQKEEGKNADEVSNRANGAKINSLSAMAKPFVPSTFAESYPFPTGTDFGTSYGVTSEKVDSTASTRKRGKKAKPNKR